MANSLIIGTTNGVWILTAGATVWTRGGEGTAITGTEQVSKFTWGSLSAGQTTPDLFAARQIDGINIWRSSDSGVTWIPKGTSSAQFCHQILVNPTGTDIYAATNRQIWKSTNNGDTWTTLPLAVNFNYFNNGLDIAVHGTAITITGANKQTLQICNIVRGTDRSPNDGLNWTRVGNFQTTYTLVASGEDCFAGTVALGVWKSTNQGISWASSSAGIQGTNTQINCILLSGSTLFACGTNIQNKIVRSTDYGANWTSISAGFPTAINFSQSKGSLALVGNTLYAGLYTANQGIYQSTDDGDNWTPVTTSGLPAGVSVYAIEGYAGAASLSLTAGSNGSVSSSPTGTSHADGTVVSISAFPDVNYSFSAWAGDVTTTSNPETVTMTANKSITALFDVTMYSLGLSSTLGGSVSSSPTGTSFSSGATVIITASWDPLTYDFAGWTGSSSGTSNPLTITMDANKSVTASFTADVYTLSLTTNGNGSISSFPAAPLSGNTIVSLTAYPDNMYALSGWNGDATGIVNPITVTMTSNKSVSAFFSKSPQGPPPGIGRFADEAFRKFTDGATISAEFVRRSLSSIRGNSAILPVEWSNFAAHTYFNSAELKTNAALTKVIAGYPIGLSGASITALGSNDVIAVENFLFQLNGFEKYVLNYLGGVTGNSYLYPDPVVTAAATTVGGIVVPLITIGRDSRNGLTGDFVTGSSNLIALAQTFDAGLNTLQLISGTATDFDIIYFDDGSYYSNRILPSERIEYVNRQSNMGGWIPEAMKMGDTENNLIRFMGTVGSIYDDIKLYIDQFANVNHINYDSWNRYPDGRIPTLIAKHFGFELIDTLLRQDLSQYLRKDTNKVALYEITYKIWNRILNNLIYLYKKKGTIEAVRSLIRIYGIPDNYLSINDYNFHPEPTISQKVDYKNVRVLSFYGNNRLDFNGFSLGTGDLTLEARVTASSVPSGWHTILSYGDGTDNISIGFDGVSACLTADNTAGNIKVTTSGALLSSAIVGWVNLFAIRRSSCGEIWATWIDDTSGSAVYNAVSAVGAWPTLQAPATLGFFIGATTTGEAGSMNVVDGWSGDIQEVKAFKFALDETDIREHTHNFESVSWMQGTANGSFDGVVGQWKLKENTVLSGAYHVVNAWTLSSSLTGRGYGSLTAGNQYKMIDAMRKETSFTDIGEFVDDNVDLYIQQGLTSPWKKSNILNVGFRPVTRVNDDILNVYGDLNTSDVIGDPANFLASVSGYAYGYPVEGASAGPVFRRWALSYPGAKIDFNAYIDVLENLAPLIEGIMHDAAQLVPARTTFVNRGVIIEQHLLESSRIHTNPPTFEPEHDYNDLIEPPRDVTSADESYDGIGTERREEYSGESSSTNDYFSLSQEQLQDLQNNLSVNEFRVVGNEVIYPFEQKVFDPLTTKLLIQANRNFLRTTSTISDWTASITGSIKLIRASTGKIITSKENCVRVVVPSSTSADVNGTITATEHWFSITIEGSTLADGQTTFDFTMPDKNGLEFQIMRKSKFNDLKIGFLTFQFTNLLSGQVGQYTILMSTDESGLGGVAELQAELQV